MISFARLLPTLVLLGLALSGCGHLASPHPGTANSLTSRERSQGWELLFDGTTENWRGFGKPGFPASGWVVEDGWFRHLPKGGGGDVITRQTFTDFEFSCEWIIAPGGNSGIKYFISEQRGAPIGHEYQVIDDAAHPDASHGPKRQTGALYDALPPAPHPAVPAGQLNRTRIIVRGQNVEHWLNDVRILTYRLDSPELATAKAASKFAREERWGTPFPTPILLQDHGDDVRFRNLKIRRL